VIDSKNNLMIITGEVSGDLIGGSLIKELKSLNPDLKITGIGGDRMKLAGMDLIYHSDQMAFLGFVEVVKHLPFIHQVQNKLIDKVKSEASRKYYESGKVMYVTYKYTDAIIEFDKALELDKYNYMALTGRGESKYALNDKEGACKDWKRAIELGSFEGQHLLDIYCK